MENTITPTGLTQPFTSSQRSAGQIGNASPAINELLAPNQPVPATPDLPETSQVQETVSPQTEGRSVPANREEPNPVVQQQQIESFLAEQTGEEASAFQGIDIQSALDLQESFRSRPEESSFAPAPASSQQPVADANEQQELQLQQTLQSRLAEKIPSDPGTEFPQLIRAIA